MTKLEEIEEVVAMQKGINCLACAVEEVVYDDMAARWEKLKDKLRDLLSKE